ncbi:MAG: hypothetical protein J6J16_07135 [Lachnospiraceae bacterium]|nr:hypothetical protein [Lachnospiraceae bacterium]
MSTKTNGTNRQHNRYEFLAGGKHTHDWYDSKTGMMGSHGENTTNEDKSWAGKRANETMTRGDWSKGVKN